MTSSPRRSSKQLGLVQRESGEETARQLDISVSTVKRSMAQASTRLSRWIEADPGLADFVEGERWAR
jgi:DNA-directed RNA polymerase specialized sigma24 family protein